MGAISDEAHAILTVLLITVGVVIGVLGHLWLAGLEHEIQVLRAEVERLRALR